MVHIVGAGPGAEDLITVRGLKFLKEADIVIYAGSLVNPGLLKETKPGAVVYDSAKIDPGTGHGSDKRCLEREKGGGSPSYGRSLPLWCHQGADG